VTAALGPATIVPRVGTDTALDICPHPIPYWTFNGSTQEWTVADSSTLEVGPNNYSMMAIFRASSAGSGTQQIVAKSAASVPKNFQMQFLHSNNKVQATGSATTQTLSSTAISEDTWYMMHLTNAGGTARLFNEDNSEGFSRTAINPGTADFAISGWLYLETLDDYGTIVSCGAGSTAQQGFDFFVRSDPLGRVTVYFNATGSARLSGNFDNAFVVGKWQHWVLNFDRSANMQLFVDGTSKGTSDISGHADSLDPAVNLFFASAAWGGHLDGRKARVIWHTKVLDSDDIAFLNNDGKGKFYSDFTAAEKTTLGIYAAWDGTEASGNLIDSHGSLDMTDNNTVTTAGGPTGATWYIDGAVDTASPISQGDATNAKDLHVGCREDDSGNATEFFQGDIAAVATWNKTLTAAEIQAQFTAFKGRDRMRPSLRNRRYGRRVASGGLF
jgi:hypothetical protein